MVQDVSEVKRSLDWLVTDFTERVADVTHAVVVSSGGVPVAVSNDIPAGHAAQLCAEMTLLAEAVGDIVTPAAR
jgi:predicted regulator of Ras-like GTPase activity (Roadblock/LC7/MglB family)